MGMVMGMAKGTDTNKVYYQPSNWDWLEKRKKKTFKFVIKKINLLFKSYYVAIYVFGL